MASTYSTNLKIQLMATGENSTTWGNVTNINLGTALEEAITGTGTVTFASANQTLSLTDTNGTQVGRNMRLALTGTTAGARDLTVPAVAKAYLVSNGTADIVTVKNATGAGIAVPAGAAMWLYSTGAGVVEGVSHLTALTLGTALPVAQGGTGSNTATFSGANITALNATNISAGTLALARGGTALGTTPTNGQLLVGNGTNYTLATITAGTNISITNGAGSITIASSSGAGGGTVTSVAGSGGATGLTFSGSPITISGTLTLGGTLALASGGTGATTAAAARTALGLGTAAVMVGPTGTIVGISDTQTLTNKILQASCTIGDTGTISSSSPGFRGSPVTTKSAAYTLGLTDGGTTISTTTGGIVIPANSGTAFPVGTVINIFNNSGSTQAISITTDTLRLSGTTSTGTRTLAVYGLAAVLKVTSTVWVVAGDVT